MSPEGIHVHMHARAHTHMLTHVDILEIFVIVGTFPTGRRHVFIRTLQK